jgi:hypothetical protein
MLDPVGSRYFRWHWAKLWILSWLRIYTVACYHQTETRLRCLFVRWYPSAAAEFAEMAVLAFTMLSALLLHTTSHTNMNKVDCNWTGFFVTAPSNWKSRARITDPWLRFRRPPWSASPRSYISMFWLISDQVKHTIRKLSMSRDQKTHVESFYST